MKRKNLILVLFILGITTLSAQDETFLSRIKISETNINKTPDRNVEVSFNMDFTNLNLKKQQTINIVPVLFSSCKTEETELPSVIVSGKTRNKVQNRLSAINCGTEKFKVLDTLKFEADMGTYKYEAMIPFKKWMIGAEIKMYAYIGGCASCEGSHEESDIEGAGEILHPYIPDYSYTYIYGMREEKQTVEYTGKLTLGFAQNNSTVKPTFNNNEVTIDSIKRLISNPYYEIKDIELTSYASPEGKERYNKLISDNRSKSFSNYLNKNIDGIKQFQIKWSGCGEDWNGLREEVEKMATLNTKKDVLDIIDNRGEKLDLAEEKLKRMGTETYSKLYKDIYPKLRRTDYRVKYTIRNFSVEESVELIDKSPELMDLYEINTLAQKYNKNSERFIEVWKKAAAAHPDDINILNNASIALIEAEETEEVIRLLGNAPKDASLINLLGVAYARTENFEKASETFKQAIRLGDAHASSNLKELENYIEYISE